MQLILGVHPKTLQNEPQMHTPTEKELQIKHEPTVADMSEKSDLHLFASVVPMYKNTDHVLVHFETVEAQQNTEVETQGLVERSHYSVIQISIF